MFIGTNIAIKIESIRVPKAVIRIPVAASKLTFVSVFVSVCLGINVCTEILFSCGYGVLSVWFVCVSKLIFVPIVVVVKYLEKEFSA